MANSNSNSGQSSLSNFDQKLYSDFSGGYNDTSAAISIEDNQLAMSENADYSAERKSLQTRKGCVKVNDDSFEAEVTDGYAWLIGSVHKKCIVMNGKVYDLDTETGEITEKITLTAGAKKIYPYVMYNVLYFGDGSELYSWGSFDYASELGKKTINQGDIVKCNNQNLGGKGHYYKYIKSTGGSSVDTLPDEITAYVDHIPDTVTVYEGGIPVTKTIVRSPYNPWYVDDMGEEDTSNWDTDRIYVNEGTTQGTYLTNHWFYYDGNQWTDGGIFKTKETYTTPRPPIIITNMSGEDTSQWDREKIYVNTGGPEGRFLKNHWFYYDAPEWKDGGLYHNDPGVLIDLSTEDYTNTNNWEDVTDVPNYSSSEVRILEPYDPSQEEIVRITVYSSATYSGVVTLCLNDVSKTINVTAGTSVSNILKKLHQLDFSEWSSEITSDNTITFTCTERKECNAGYIDGSTTQIQFMYNTVQEGKSSNCDVTDIRKCTVFCVHQGSSRVFAAGNPEDNAIYYSEIGYGNYFQSQTNKLYPAINGYGHVTGMCNLSSALVVSYENGWYTWRGITPLQDAYWEPLNIPYGCVSPRTLCLTPQGFTFLAKDGIYTVSAAILNEQYILLQTKQIIKRISEDAVEKTIESFVDKSLCTAVFYDNMYMISYSTNGEYCDRVLKYEWDTGAFTLVTGWTVHSWINDYDNLFFASDNFVLKAFEGYSDIDTETGEEKAIELHVKTKEYYLDTPQANKVLQMIAFLFQQYDKLNSPIQIIVHAGYKKYEISDVDLAESLYYGRLWGTAWGYRHAIIKVAELVIVSNAFQIEIIANNIDDPMTLLGIGFSYADTDLVLPTLLKDEELMV